MLEDIKISDGKIKLDDDFKQYEEGVALLIFKEKEIIKGGYPQGFPLDVPIQVGKISTISQNDEKWIVYDVRLDEEMYIRGIYKLDEISQPINQIMIIALITFPFVVFIAAAGGYFITKKAFSPVTRISNIANSIYSGSDLSQRIKLDDTGDEISSLAKIFDLMLDRLEKAFDGEKQFTSDVSHELRTPIAIMKSQCEYAISQDNNENTRKALLEILSQIDKMTLLITQLLEFSRAEQQIKFLQFEIINLSELLEIVVEELAEEAEIKSISLTVNPGRNIMVNCEQTLIMRLVINLITNAIKYTNENGTVEVGLEENEKTVVLSVSDTGIGIAPENIDKIFNRFYRVDSSRASSQKNSFGLGLSICKWIVLAHHGDIVIQSQVGKGSSFIVTIPK